MVDTNNNLKNSNEEYSKALEEIHKDSRLIKGSTIEAFIKKPVQRLYRYRLLFEVG